MTRASSPGAREREAKLRCDLCGKRGVPLLPAKDEEGAKLLICRACVESVCAEDAK